MANSNDNAVVVISDVSDAIVATITMSSANADPYDVAYDSVKERSTSQIMATTQFQLFQVLPIL